MRFACPSWVFPGTWSENLDFILARDPCPVDGVELLVFEYDGTCRSELLQEIPAILRAAERLDLTVHLPVPLGPGASELVEVLGEHVQGFVVHPPEPPGDAAFLEFMALTLGKPGPWTALEYTNAADFRRALALLDAEFPAPGSTGICVDSGHLLLDAVDPGDFFRLHASRVRHVHLHDVAGTDGGQESRGRDHAPLVAGREWLEGFLTAARGFPGLVELELFDWNAVAGSIGVVRRMLEGMSRGGAKKGRNPATGAAASGCRYGGS